RQQARRTPCAAPVARAGGGALPPIPSPGFTPRQYTGTAPFVTPAGAFPYYGPRPDARTRCRRTTTMRIRLLGAATALALIAALLCAGDDAAAQSRAMPPRIDGRPNLNGVWQAIGSAHWNLEAHPAEA